ncbi:MAG TPA: hypothetical protein VF796_07375 [Humisphaera sp.]
MRFARWTFRVAGVYGLVTVTPQYFLERQFNADHPPAITHPEFYYGFLGLCVAWQVMFLLIGSDPVRYRPAMLVSVVEKASFALAVPALFAAGRVPGMMVPLAAVDAVLGVLFAVAWVRTPRGWPR